MKYEEMMKYKEQCEKDYLNWFNNYLSISKFAEDMNCTESYAQEILRVGREYHFDKMLSPTFEDYFELHN